MFARWVLPHLQALLVLLLLFIDYPEPEVYLVRLLEVGLHSHDLGERLLGMFERAITIVQNAYAIPKLGLLQK